LIGLQNINWLQTPSFKPPKLWVIKLVEGITVQRCKTRCLPPKTRRFRGSSSTISYYTCTSASINTLTVLKQTIATDESITNKVLTQIEACYLPAIGVWGTKSSSLIFENSLFTFEQLSKFPTTEYTPHITINSRRLITFTSILIFLLYFCPSFIFIIISTTITKLTTNIQSIYQHSRRN